MSEILTGPRSDATPTAIPLRRWRVVYRGLRLILVASVLLVGAAVVLGLIDVVFAAVPETATSAYHFSQWVGVAICAGLALLLASLLLLVIGILCCSAVPARSGAESPIAAAGLLLILGPLVIFATALHFLPEIATTPDRPHLRPIFLAVLACVGLAHLFFVIGLGRINRFFHSENAKRFGTGYIVVSAMFLSGNIAGGICVTIPKNTATVDRPHQPAPLNPWINRLREIVPAGAVSLLDTLMFVLFFWYVKATSDVIGRALAQSKATPAETAYPTPSA